jgi:superfamily II DNA or RNA helicase
MISRETIQEESLAALLNSKSTGSVVVLSTGTGKSKVAIDYIKQSQSKSILITSPRTNLKENWRNELEKWGIFRENPENPESYIYNKKELLINIVNIQTCYKWDKEILKMYDLIIVDEAHLIISPKYGQLLINAKELGIKVVGLTGTPDDRKKDKALFYQQYCPIVYRYLDSAKDGIVNKRKYIVFEYELDNNYQIEVKTKFKRWYSGEKKHYNYVQSQINIGEQLIRNILNVKDDEYVNYFGYARAWYFNKTISTEKKQAGGTYIRGVTARQELLWSLNSTAVLAKRMSTIIQETYKDSKVLVFSSRTEQAEKISNNCVHSKNSKEDNEIHLEQFNDGVLRQLGSCYSLTLGLNLKNAGFAIMESYNGSDVQFKQRAGRTDRLPVDEDAIVTFIVVKNTQGEKWFNNSVNFDEDDEVRIVKSIKEFKEALLELKPVEL